MTKAGFEKLQPEEGRFVGSLEKEGRAEEGRSVSPIANSRRIGIMGGTFDPIHVAHLECAAMACNELLLDEVLFMPAGIPSFKRDMEVSSAVDRLEMCRLACEGNNLFHVSDMECRREGVTYSIDSIKEMSSGEYASDELFFIIGSDAFLSLPKWRSADELVDLVDFAVLLRPGDNEMDVWRIAGETNARIHLVDCPKLAVSSSLIREYVRIGRTIRYLVPDPVREYIQEHELYRKRIELGSQDGALEHASNANAASGASDGTQVGDHGHGIVQDAAYGSLQDAAKDALSGSGRMPRDAEAEAVGKMLAGCEDPLGDEFYDGMRSLLVDRVSPKRLAHIDGVSDTAQKLAEAYGVDVGKARLAALLHDWDKGLDDDQVALRVQELGIEDEVGEWTVKNMPQVVHGPSAAAALARDFPCIPEDVIHSIKVHTLACPDMSALDKVIYIADAIEPGRKFDRLKDLQSLVGNVSLDDLFLEVYRFWTIALVEFGRVLHPDTIDIWNEYAQQGGGKRSLLLNKKKPRHKKK